MNFTLALLSLFAITATAKNNMIELKDINADSSLGRSVLSKATRVESEERNLEDWAQLQSDWVAGFSIKFQGCHHLSQWNSEADGEEDVRIITKHLVRFRLCPTNYCSTSGNQGCSSGYGDYIIDMETFLTAYFEADAAKQSYAYDGASSYATDMSAFMACGKSGYSNSDGNYFYIGPYCASQGGAIYLGMFTDDSCSAFADNNGGRNVYSTLAGAALPYGNKNIVQMDCIGCTEASANSKYYGNDNDDADSVLDYCETLYNKAGKCETNLAYGTTYITNTNACNFIEGVKVVRQDGTVVTAEAKANKTAGAFIGIFSIGFVALSAYVYFLKTKLDRASINLTED
jgi:hypothetical protein